MRLTYVGGEKDGEVYECDTPPLAVIRKDCPGGKYVYVAPHPQSVTQFAPFLQWVARK